MNKLLSLQNKFQKYLLYLDQNIYRDIVGTKKVLVANRLDIYANAYRLRLVEVLAGSYPVLKAHLGNKKFAVLANEYIDSYPSHSPSLRWFGDQLEYFLIQHPKYKRSQYLTELAKVEWTMESVFDATNSDIVTLEFVAKIPLKAWANMRLRMHTSLYCLDLSWNVMQLWEAISLKKTPKKMRQNKSSEHWIFWRQDLINQCRLLPVDEAYALSAILKGKKFGEVCEGLRQWVGEDEVGMRAATLLKGWVAQGLVAEIRI